MQIRKAYIDTACGQIHVRNLEAINQDAPPLLCLHPAPSSGLYFTTAMPLLHEKRQVIAPDYPGYGASDPLSRAPTIGDYAEAMLETVAAMDLDSPIDVLGFHTGCLVGTEMALRSPDLVRHLVLCDVPYFLAEVREKLREAHAKPMSIGTDLESIAGPWAFNVQNRVPQVELPRAIRLLAEHLRIGSEDYRAFHSAFSYECESRFPALKTETTIIATQSGLLDPSRSAANAVERAKLVEALEIDTAVFESNATNIASYILEALPS